MATMMMKWYSFRGPCGARSEYIICMHKYMCRKDTVRYIVRLRRWADLILFKDCMRW